MASKTAILTVTCIIMVCVDMGSGAPTRLVPSKPSELELAAPSQEDSDQFFKDQPHLSAQEENQPTTINIFGNYMNQLPYITQATDLYQLAMMLTQLGVPMINPSSLSQTVMVGSMEFLSGLMGSQRNDQITTRPFVMSIVE